jgi:hypothetical protein
LAALVAVEKKEKHEKLEKHGNVCGSGEDAPSGVDVFRAFRGSKDGPAGAGGGRNLAWGTALLGCG